MKPKFEIGSPVFYDEELIEALHGECIGDGTPKEKLIKKIIITGDGFFYDVGCMNPQIEEYRLINRQDVRCFLEEFVDSLKDGIDQIMKKLERSSDEIRCDKHEKTGNRRRV